MRATEIETRRLVGGALCLDFANSVDWDGEDYERPSHTDVLREPADLALWGARLGVCDSSAAATGRDLKAARDLRGTIHRIFSAIAGGGRPDQHSLDALVRSYRDGTAAATLTTADRLWRLECPADDPRQVRFAVAADALDLLRDPERLGRVRRCPGGNCGWLFLDATGRRRWCSMEVCGSRAKMRALYERKKQRASSAPGAIPDALDSPQAPR